MVLLAAQSGRIRGGGAYARRSFGGQASRQRGNALIFVLLALIISALGMAGYVTSKQIAVKTQAGQVEATVLELLRNAANSVISDNVPAIQQGLALTKTVGALTTTITPTTVGGELVWEPSPAQLRDMGYLPEGWNATTSNLNGAQYSVTFRRTPAGCAPINCNIDGAVVILGPINDPGSGRSDGVVIGPILTKIGADSAVSLAISPAVLTGYGNTWTMPNPLPTAPVGVVAVRVGTASSAFASFVRIGDLRDPNLAGNLTVAGALNINGASNLQALTTAGVVTANGAVVTNGTLTANGAVTVNNAVTANGAVTVNNAPLTVANAGGVGCTTITAAGITVNCAGTINVTAGGVTVRGGDIDSDRALRGQNVQFTVPVADGDACPSTNSVAGLAGGGLAVCGPGPTPRYRAVMRYGLAGANCPPLVGPGTLAVDSNTAEGLVCRGNVWTPVQQLLSNFVLMATTSVVNGSPVPMPSCRNAVPSQPLLFLLPANEAAGLNPGLRHSAVVAAGSVRAANAGYDVGGEWTVELTDYAGVPAQAPLPPSNAIAMTYCYYP